MLYRNFIFPLVTFLLFLSPSDAQEAERILGVGAATIDLLIPVDDQFLATHNYIKKGGSNKSDPDTIERVICASRIKAKIVPGGSAANTIRALAKLGEKCAFFTRIGTDAYGEQFSKNMRALGVEERFDKCSSYSTSRVLCLITPDSQRTFLGFDQEITDLTPSVDAFKNLKWVHIEARQLKSGICIEKIMQLSKDSGAKISLDLSCFELVGEFKDVLLDLISRYVDVVFCNQDEIRSLTGLSPK